ncbi:unnamed protein product [Amoebophrya sp. A120]|nr:unnamed protein product [Amoebophrya sp. A120]|eukprot:GSA120T00004136001.1
MPHGTDEFFSAAALGAAAGEASPSYTASTATSVCSAEPQKFVSGAGTRDIPPNKKAIFDEKLLHDFLENRLGTKKEHANTIWRTLLKSGGDFDALRDIPTFPPRVIPLLKEEFAYCTSYVSCMEQSALDGTIKLLIKLSNGSEIEAVIINHTGEDMNSAINMVRSGKEEQDEEGKAKTQMLPGTRTSSNKATSSTSASNTTKTSTATENHTMLREDKIYTERGIIETNKPRIEMRKTLCVSSQVGCNLGCTFCATGTMKLEKSLSAGEIMEQLLLADHVLSVLTKEKTACLNETTSTQAASTDDMKSPTSSTAGTSTTRTHQRTNFKPDLATQPARQTSSTSRSDLLERIAGERHAYFGSFISNVVFMGMGEPLENYDSVVAALKGMCSQQRFGLGYRNCTVSTVGIIPRMRQLFTELPNVKLALSLHAPNQGLRNQIVPVSKKYHLPELMDTLDEYAKKHATDGKRKGLVMISYVMIDGVNDTKECCEELCALLKNRQVLVNLIPFNQFDPYANQPARGGKKLKSHPAEHYRPSKPEQIVWFASEIEKSGIKAFERRPHGRDISAACGQLAKIKKTDNSVFEEVGEIEGNQKKYINKVVPLSREVVRTKKNQDGGAGATTLDTVSEYFTQVQSNWNSWVASVGTSVQATFSSGASSDSSYQKAAFETKSRNDSDKEELDGELESSMSWTSLTSHVIPIAISVAAVAGGVALANGAGRRGK